VSTQLRAGITHCPACRASLPDLGDDPDPARRWAEVTGQSTPRPAAAAPPREEDAPTKSNLVSKTAVLAAAVGCAFVAFVLVIGLVNLSSSQSNTIEPPREKWQDLKNWQQLRQGMSESEVRRILGEPARIEHFKVAAGAAWYYGEGLNDASVVIMDGGVRGWQAPGPDALRRAFSRPPPSTPPVERAPFATSPGPQPPRNRPPGTAYPVSPSPPPRPPVLHHARPSTTRPATGRRTTARPPR
jgi:hypothetical protein